MSKNLKAINFLKNFLENQTGVSTYDRKDYGLNNNYSLKIIIKIEKGGNNGGDCWGGTSCEYYKSEEMMKSDFESELNYIIRPLNSFFNLDEKEVQKLISIESTNLDSIEIASCESTCDPYGNNTYYNIYAFDCLAFFKKVMNKDHFQIFKGVASAVKVAKDNEFKSLQLLEQEQILVNQINEFYENKVSQHNNLDKNLLETKARLEKIISELKEFESKKELEKVNLEESLIKLRKEREIHEGKEVTHCQPEIKLKKNKQAWK